MIAGKRVNRSRGTCSSAMRIQTQCHIRSFGQQGNSRQALTCRAANCKSGGVLCRAATSTTAADQAQNASSSLAAAMAASLIAAATFSPVALADEECVGAFCSGSKGSAVQSAQEFTSSQKQKLQAADESFAKSDTLKALLEKSEANRAKNKKAIANKYCYRQAELGIGDCGGLRYIPGMTKNGKQETPGWLQKVLGVEVPKVEGQGKTLADLLGPEAEQ